MRDEITFFERKSSAQTAVSAKKAKVAARAQVAQGEHVTPTNLKNYSSGSLFQASLNRSKDNVLILRK